MSNSLEDGSYAVPPGHLAVVVTHLVCTAPIAPRSPPPGVLLYSETRLDAATYRELFRLVGRDWLWTSRLMLDDDALLAVLLDRNVTLQIVEQAGERVGMVELDFRNPNDPQIAFFGVVPSHTGRGLGPWMMGEVQKVAFSQGARRLRVNTCTLDSPHALRFYQRYGFHPERREVRVFPDPRAIGVLDEAAAPHVPRL